MMDAFWVDQLRQKIQKIATAGEDLEFGDCVIFGEDGKIYKAKQ